LPGDDGGTITLQGVTSTDVTADIFAFAEESTSGTIFIGSEAETEFTGGEFGDTVIGAEGDDTLDGGGGNDWIFGNEGADDLQGGAGDDVIFGGEGDDTINAGTGSNFAHGGAGADTFVVESGQTLTTIGDFTDGEDQIDLSNISGITGFDDLTITADGDDVVINLSDHGAGSVRLENVAVADLDADDFVFAASTTVVDDGM
jgi:Ca2+-binding RTX toxin-like protein